MTQKTAPQKNRFGCLRIIGILFVLSIICGGGITFWQNRLFNDFHERYLAGNCDGIHDIYDQLVLSDDAKEEQARYELQGCDFLLAAQRYEQTGNYASAFGHYIELQQSYADTTLATIGTDSIAALLNDPAPILADADFCESLDNFGTSTRTPENLKTFIAENWITCAETLRDAGEGLGECAGCSAGQAAAVHYSELITYIETNAELYPVDEAVIDTVLADVMARQAEIVGAGEISLPPGREIGGTNAVLVIQNAAPQALRIALSGGASSTSTVESIPVCEDCITYTGAGPAECPDSEIISTIEVPAGSYNVIVNTIGGGVVTPYVGTWDLEAGTEYFQCFFIVSQ